MLTLLIAMGCIILFVKFWRIFVPITVFLVVMLLVFGLWYKYDQHQERVERQSPAVQRLMQNVK